MSTVSQTHITSTTDLRSETTWVECISLLRSYARRFVHSANVGRWHYQEEDIVEDIVQETIRRFVERYQRAESGELPPIRSPKHVIVKIAHNYCIDMWRRDRRLQNTFSDGDPLGEISSTVSDPMGLLDVATEHVYLEELFTHLAYEVARFPSKQREALLIDLASRMHFDAELTPLQRAFLAEGINLQAYQRALTSDLTERARQNSLASLAYKRVATCMRKYVLEKWEEG